MPRLLNSKGFTFIEIILVVTIIGLMGAVFITITSSAPKKARDTRRQSDIKQYQNALEVYASRNNGLYPSEPVAAGVQNSTTLCADLGITGCPEDPLNGSTPSRFYKYQSDGAGGGAAGATKYLMWVQYENSTNYWVVCSDGKSGSIASVANSGLGECATGL